MTGSELGDVHLKSESPICKLKIERSRLINSSFDLSKVCTTATTLEALGLQAPAHSELSLQDNLLCGVTLKLNPHVKILSSTRDILSSEEGVKEGRNLTIEGGALTRLKVSELSLDAGHLALDGVSAEESHFQIALAELKKEWSGVGFVKQLKSLKLETDSSSESAEEPERAPKREADKTPKQATEEVLHKLEQLQLRLKERVTKTEGHNSLWGMKANQCHLNNVRELSLPVRNVRFTNTQIIGKATNSEPLKFTIPNEELSIKGCRLERLDLLERLDRLERQYLLEIH